MHLVHNSHSMILLFNGIFDLKVTSVKSKNFYFISVGCCLMRTLQKSLHQKKGAQGATGQSQINQTQEKGGETKEEKKDEPSPVGRDSRENWISIAGN